MNTNEQQALAAAHQVYFHDDDDDGGDWVKLGSTAEQITRNFARYMAPMIAQACHDLRTAGATDDAIKAAQSLMENLSMARLAEILPGMLQRIERDLAGPAH